MGKKEIIIIADYSHDERVSLEELCDACDISADFLHELMSHDILSPHGASPDEWDFDAAALQRVKTALRLQRDLHVNLEGIALALELLDELDELRGKMHLIERHYISD